MAAFVNEGRMADILGPGLYTLSTQTLPLLTNLMNWDKAFKSPFKSDVYFFSTRLQLNQRWGTANPITIRDKEFGVVRLRGFGTYAYWLSDPGAFHARVSGTRDVYRVADVEGQLRDIIVSRMTETFAASGVPFLDMAASQSGLAEAIAGRVQPQFKELGLTLTTLIIENLSLPDELQKRLDELIGMSIVGDLGRYAKFQVAQSIPTAAANPGGGSASVGAGLGAGIAMGQSMMDALKPDAPGATNPCAKCGKPVPPQAKFCPECGAAQS